MVKPIQKGAALVAGAVFLLLGALPGVPLSAQMKAAPQGSSAATPPIAKPSTPAPKKKPVKRKRRPRGQAAPSADRIREIQSALAGAGHYKREPTGKWDAATVEALRSFQSAIGFSATGKLDAHTLQKLGLGSEIAGQAPPRSSAANVAPPARQ